MDNAEEQRLCIVCTPTAFFKKELLLNLMSIRKYLTIYNCFFVGQPNLENDSGTNIITLDFPYF
ncbi:unnamed protein product [Blumeria hordei]|uniref:Uncharacterized protein n=1 Tax=Blumeria hordei TaxID=2867405 RepID=A0A383UUF4_BLUHO|nr:unnamed protein product [Blumeria hordei]